MKVFRSELEGFKFVGIAFLIFIFANFALFAFTSSSVSLMDSLSLKVDHP